MHPYKFYYHRNIKLFAMYYTDIGIAIICIINGKQSYMLVCIIILNNS